METSEATFRSIAGSFDSSLSRTTDKWMLQVYVSEDTCDN